MPKSSWASITSRPLFMRVDESMVILGPIDHVGWASASATVTAPSRSAGQPRNGPPDAVSSSRATSVVGLHRGQALVQGAVLGVHRDDLGPRRAPGLLHDGRAGDERLLVGQREPLAGLERRHRHRQAGEADHRVEHHVGAAGRRDHALLPHQDLGPGRHAVAHLAVAGRVADHDQLGPELGRLGHELARPSAGPPARARGSARARVRMTSSAWVPTEPVEPIRLTVRNQLTRGAAP